MATERPLSEFTSALTSGWPGGSWPSSPYPVPVLLGAHALSQPARQALGGTSPETEGAMTQSASQHLQAADTGDRTTAVVTRLLLGRWELATKPVPEGAAGRAALPGVPGKREGEPSLQGPVRVSERGTSMSSIRGPPRFALSTSVCYLVGDENILNVIF